MEETLGKRIVTNRKRLGLTQDALADKLGVTAQAVSKWENDQSCPDITMLPKLAQLFGCTVDELLGVERAVEATLVQEEQEPEGVHIQKGNWEFRWDAGRRSSVGIAVWVLLSGFLLFLVNDAGLGADLWEILWTTGLTLYGLFGIMYPKFSLYRLACAMTGGYFLCTEVFGRSLQADFLLPVFLMCFGLSLLIKALRRPRESSWQVTRGGKQVSRKNCTMEGETFDCETSFGENSFLIQLPRLSRGSAKVSFGEMELDLSGCEEIADGCRIKADCSFGELQLLVPRKWQVVPNVRTSFASYETAGTHDTEPEGQIYVNGTANFGEISVKYI